MCGYVVDDVRFRANRRATDLTAVVFIVILSTGLPAAQSPVAAVDHPTAAKGGGRVSRTPWGDPDLTGIWPSNDMLGTPFERPPEFGTRNRLTDKEFAAREAQSRSGAERDAETVVVKGASADRGDGHGPPSHWAEHGKPSRQASLVVDPPNGQLPAMTPEGQRRAKGMRSTYYYDFPDLVEAHPFEQFDDLGPYDRCITRGVLPSMLPTGYNMGMQIVQSPGFVVIRIEMIHETRVVPLDARPHIGSKIRSYMGDSRGHWDGDTLVVETTNMNGKVGLTFNGNTTPTSEQLRIVERFTRVAPDTMHYEATVEDPAIWTRPWTVALPLRLQPSYGMFEYACHEGNYGMRNILSGARVEESAGQAAPTTSR
jgi:hypothetical protein